MGTVKIVLELKLQIFYSHMLMENHHSNTKNSVENVGNRYFHIYIILKMKLIQTLR